MVTGISLVPCTWLCISTCNGASGFLCSYDGVPFLMHDETLRRTTNVEEAFPERAYEHSSMFNWTDLEKLNAGEWFLQVRVAAERVSWSRGHGVKAHA